LVRGAEPELEVRILQNNLRIESERNEPVDRYVDRSVRDIPRDPEIEEDRSLWVESDGYQNKIPLLYGQAQAFILYYKSPPDKHGLHPFNKYKIQMEYNKGLPYYKVKDQVHWLPVNLRPDCATLGFA
jgi:hypothetical protein